MSTPAQAPRSWRSPRRLALVLVLLVGTTYLLAGTFRHAPTFETCAGATSILEQRLAELAATTELRMQTEPELRAATRDQLFELSAGSEVVAAALTETPCSIETTLETLDVDQRPEPLRTILAHVVADHVMKMEGVQFTDLPHAVRDVLVVTDVPGGPRGQMVSDNYSQGNMVVIAVGDGTDCPCFWDVSRAVAQADPSWDLNVYVVGEEGSVGDEVAQRFGWDLIDPRDFPGRSLLITDLSAMVIRNGVMVAQLEGASEISALDSAFGGLAYPLDPSAQEVHLRLLPRAEACDGYRAAGVIVNETNRPIHAMVMTDPNAEFTEEGWPISMRRFHDLGRVAPYEHVFFDVKTGSEAYAPCWVSTTAVYADGEWRDQAISIEDPQYPPGYTNDPDELLRRRGWNLPQQVIPATGFPTPADVRPVPSDLRSD